MILSSDPADLVRAASGVAMAALGLVVLAVDRRAPLNRALALYAIPMGLAQTLVNGVRNDLGLVTDVSFYATSAALLVGTLGVLLLALRFPAPLGGRARGLFVLPAIAGGSYLVASLALMTWSDSLVFLVFGVSSVYPIAAFWFLLFTLAARERRAPEGGHALMTAALVLWPGILGGLLALGGFNAEAFPRAVGYAQIGLCIALAVTWLASAHRRGDRAAVARNVALVVLAAPLAGMLLALGGLGGYGTGIARLAGVAVIAYAIVRHQLLGIDVKVRWTLSKSTVAAAFVAMFFVASEGAQLLFGGENQLVGLVAAGALVFAIAPLQRAADRLAERAVPVTAPTPAPGAPGSVDAYRIALRRFLADGRISVEEELALARIATHERLTPEEALRVRHEVEAELGRRAA